MQKFPLDLKRHYFILFDYYLFKKRAVVIKQKPKKRNCNVKAYKLCKNVTVEMNFLCVPYAQLTERQRGKETRREGRKTNNINFKRNDNLNSIKLTHQLQAH
jgi:hypothetical protein